MSEHTCPNCGKIAHCSQLDCTMPEQLCDLCFGKITLSERDFKTFVDAINNPPEPNDALKKALKDYKDKYKWVIKCLLFILYY
jgi:hypothetical protein